MGLIDRSTIKGISQQLRVHHCYNLQKKMQREPTIKVLY